MWHSAAWQIPEQHPAAEGHFPGNPIIPGAVLLDEVVRRATEGRPAGAPCGIRAAKFLQPVRPGDRLLIRWQPVAEGAVKFDCLIEDTGQIVLKGTLDPGGIPC